MNLKKLIKNLLILSYENKISHIPSALSQLSYFKYLIPELIDKRFDWVAGKQFGQLSYFVIYKELNKEKLKNNIKLDTPLLYNNVNTEFKFIEETLGNSLGVAIGLALSGKKPIWVNLSDSVFQMGSTLEAIGLLKKFNPNILITVDNNGYTRSDKIDKNSIKKIFKAYGIKNITIDIKEDNKNKIKKQIKKLIDLDGPRCIIFNTVKGNGIYKYTNDPIKYHYEIIKTKKELTNLLKELD